MIFFTRNERFSKLFFILCFGGLLMYIILAFYTFHTSLSSMSQTRKVQKKMQNIQDSDVDVYVNTDAVTKYILLWKFKEDDDENPIGEGRRAFIERGCMHHNCYITTDKTMLGQVSSFDAIIFDAKDLKRWKKDRFPKKRDAKQIYVFYGKMSAYESPICHPQADNFFNWTWSYKLYSDIFSPFIEVKDMKGNYVAPSITASWKMPELNMVTDDQKNDNNNTFKNKKAMATILEDCYINTELKSKLVALKTIQNNFKEYKMDFDIYGCKFIKCPDGDCVSAIKDKYYFYWVHELGLTEDYLTDEVIKAHEMNAVPVIFGGADLNKFLPPDSYINAYLTDPDTLVASIFYSIKKPSVYKQFMNWKDYYTITRADPYKGLCQLCSYLKSKKKMVPKHYGMFRRWWYQGPLHDRCIKRFKNSEEPLAYLNETRPTVLKEYRIVPLTTEKKVEKKIKKDTSQL